ncbi:MAG: hypothetical protein PSU94_00900 [Lacunisphaera sp.]|nr:hypothetical protein [Lacunisphaera sp.]
MVWDAGNRVMAGAVSARRADAARTPAKTANPRRPALNRPQAVSEKKFLCDDWTRVGDFMASGEVRTPHDNPAAEFRYSRQGFTAPDPWPEQALLPSGATA